MIPKNLLLVVGAGLLGAAVTEELLKSRDERTWQGRIAGFIPYDLRLATPQGFRHAKEHPEDARLVLGYTLDLPRAAKLVRRALPF